ncbi:MAG: hypothetical protein QXD23_02050 [Candidatus Micrarchaeaceae archaeon]
MKNPQIKTKTGEKSENKILPKAKDAEVVFRKELDNELFSKAYSSPNSGVLIEIYEYSRKQPEAVQTKLLLSLLDNSNIPSKLVNDIFLDEKVSETVKIEAKKLLLERIKGFKRYY